MHSSCLVLDVGYQPHRIIPWQRAVALLFQGKANLVESYDERLMSEDQERRARARGLTIVIDKVPAVIKLIRAVKRKKRVRFSRMNVLTRDQWHCQYCGKEFETHDLNYDHVLPRSQGGKTTWKNIVTSCYPCNDKKAGRTPAQAGMRLLKQPVQPKSLPVIAFHFSKSASYPEVWEDWLFWNREIKG